MQNPRTSMRDREQRGALRRFDCRELAERLKDDEGAVTAEYAVVIMGAVAFAGVLVAIMRSGEVREFLLSLVQSALSSAG